MKLFLRPLTIALVEIGALLLLSGLLPGFDVRNGWSAFGVILLFGLLNATLRSLILAKSVRLLLVLFGLIGFVSTAVMMALALVLAPGVVVRDLWSLLFVSVVLALFTTAVSGLPSIDEGDLLYGNIIRSLSGRRGRAAGGVGHGLIVVQIDGLAEPIVRRQLESGHMPTLARWLASGSHTLVRWHCDIPSMTSGSQAGIMHGNNANIPAFRWYEKESGRLLVSNHPRDAFLIDQRQSVGKGLLREHGSSHSNIFKAGADRYVLTMSGLTDSADRLSLRMQDFYPYLSSPYSITRDLIGMAGSALLEYWQAWRQRRRNIVPRMYRGGVFPLLRGVSTVLLRDITVRVTISDMQRGQSVIYLDLLGYDEVAHHAGPAYADALNVLTGLDRQIRLLEIAAKMAPRPYELVVLSDHGQSYGATFRQRYGLTLDQLVEQLLGGRHDASLKAGQGEGYGHLNAVLMELLHTVGASGGILARLLPRHFASGVVETGPDREHRRSAGEAEVVVAASGNLANLYFTRQPGRLSLETITAAHPALIDGLAGHDGIGFIVVCSESRGPLVIGKGGERELVSGTISGKDPIASLEPHTAQFLRRLASFPNAGDIIINSRWDAATGEVAAFEELIGCHGGAGGMQTQPFLIYPSTWSAESPNLIGAEALHDFLAAHIEVLQPRATATQAQPRP